ncbi:hypothetical protein [Streptomyces sp. NPDC096142]
MKSIRKLIARLKVRVYGYVRPHVSAGRVCAICEVCLVIGWFYDHRS